MEAGPYFIEDNFRKLGILKPPTLTYWPINPEQLHQSKLIHAKDFILSPPPYCDILRYLPDEFTSDYVFSLSKNIYELKDERKEEPDKILESRNEEMLGLCSKDESASIILSIPFEFQVNKIQWHYFKPLIFKIEKFPSYCNGEWRYRYDPEYKKIRVLNVCYLYEGQEFSILRIDFANLFIYARLLFCLLNYFTPLPFADIMSLHSETLFDISYNKRIERSIGLSYFPQISETLRERLYLIGAQPKFEFFGDDLKQLFPIIMNLIFALKVIKRIYIENFDYMEATTKNIFNALFKYMFSSDFFKAPFQRGLKKEIDLVLDTNKILTKDLNNIIQEYLFFPFFGKLPLSRRVKDINGVLNTLLLSDSLNNIILEYLSFTSFDKCQSLIELYECHYEVLIRPQVLSLFVQKNGTFNFNEKDLESSLNSMFSKLQEEGVINYYKLVKGNSAYSEKDNRIVTYNGYYYEMSYQDIHALFEYFERSITFPLYPLGAAQQKFDTLTNMHAFLNNKKTALLNQKKEVADDMTRMSHNMRLYPRDLNFVPKIT